VLKQIPKKCVCGVNPKEANWQKAGFRVGITGNVIFLILSLVFLALYIFDKDTFLLLPPLLWTAISLIDFGVSLLSRRLKKHTWACSIRYAKINIFYSGVIF
jgi:hypothetical protein